MNIYQIKNRTLETSPFYFQRKTLKFFGQTLKDFKVKKDGTRYKISAPIRDRNTGKTMGISVRFFNPANNKLELN